MNTKVIHLNHKGSGVIEANEISINIEEKETLARITIGAPSSSIDEPNIISEDLVRVHWHGDEHWIEFMNGTKTNFSDLDSYYPYPENSSSDGTAQSYYPGFLLQNTDWLKGCWGDALYELYSPASACRYNAFMRIPLAVLYGVTYLRGASGNVVLNSYPPDQFGRLTQIIHWSPINNINPPGYTWCLVAGDPIYMQASGLA